MADFRHRITLRFLRRFSAFRALEQRVQLLSEHAQREREALSRGTVARVEAEVLHALCLSVPHWIHVDVLPTQRVGWLGPSELRARVFEGGGP